MAYYSLRNEVLELRKCGMSYSQIKAKIPVSKSTLSLWLREYPLSRKRINELRANSEQRIERCRETKAKNKKTKLDAVYKEVKKDIQHLSKRELYLLGLALYWTEGTKASSSTICMTNTDLSVLKLFLRWLDIVGVGRSRVVVRLHLYSDMDVQEKVRWWSENLCIPVKNFRKPYIKKTVYNKRKNYKGRFGNGTCNVMVYDTRLFERTMMGIKVLQEL